MKALIYTLLLISSGLSSITWAQETWHDRQGNTIPESDTNRSIDGFAGLLVVTSDEDWREKWNTSPETVPEFTAAKSPIRNNDKLFFLTLLSNPATNSEGMADVSCSLTVTRPDGTVSLSEKEAPCFQASLAGGTHNLYLSGLVAGFLAEPKDLRGQWTVSVTLKDKIRNVSLTLKSSFLVE
jgi:hypothetical protein